MNSSVQQYRIIIPQSDHEIRKYYDLRYEVLRKPWSQDRQSVKDDREDTSLHALMLDEHDEAIATGRLQFNSPTEGQIRSMAVSENYRNKGLGSEMLKFLEAKAGEKNFQQIILDARKDAVNFYKKNGYSVDGKSYTLFGVIPHFRMSKNLHR